MIEVTAHHRQYLRDATRYACGDLKLARRFVWHDKHILSHVLGQPSWHLPAGRYVVKPALNDGLGWGAHELDLAARDHVIQPYGEGPYRNVDAVCVGGRCYHWIYSGQRQWTRFRWFRYLGTDPQVLTARQREMVARLLETLPEGWPVNLEMVGDYAMEAHARLSLQFADIPLYAGDPDPITLCTDATPLQVRPLAGAIFFSIPAHCTVKLTADACRPLVEEMAHRDGLRPLSYQWTAESDGRPVDGAWRVLVMNCALQPPEDPEAAAEALHRHLERRLAELAGLA